MSEVYWPEIQNTISASNFTWLAQTFTPLETHNVNFIKLKFNTWGSAGTLHIAIQYLKPDGTPTGADLTYTTLAINQAYRLPPHQNYILGIPGFQLVKSVSYALVLYVEEFLFIGAVDFAYKQPPSDYPRGKLIASYNTGHTWDTTDLGDLCFAEWGYPLLPKPTPPPPVENIAILRFFYTHYDTGLFITTITDVPCHLTCFYTGRKPLKHDITRIERGIGVPWSTYFCFVAWDAIEQTQEGDTLYHTFQIPDWTQCQTKWFTIRGEFDQQVSPSIGPIVKHHHPGGLPMIVRLRPNAPGDLCNPRLTGTGQPCPFHYATVMWPPPQNDLEYLVGDTINRWWGYDSYEIEKAELGAIDSVKLTCRWKAQGGYAYSRVNAFLLRIDAISFIATERDILSDWRYYEKEYPLNPRTSEKWTQEDLDNLQIGVGLRFTWSVDWFRKGSCSEVSIDVERGINGLP